MPGMRFFLDEHGTRWPPDAAGAPARAMARALAEAELREALARWWAPRLDRIADWVADTETQRRSEHRVTAIVAEAAGTWELRRDGGPFTLTGRADRIERRADGALAILDYKTGTPPTPEGGGCRPGAAASAGGGDGGCRRVRSRRCPARRQS